MQAGLRLCCSHPIENRFSRVKAQIILVLPSETVWPPPQRGGFILFLQLVRALTNNSQENRRQSLSWISIENNNKAALKLLHGQMPSQFMYSLGKTRTQRTFMNNLWSAHGIRFYKCGISNLTYIGASQSNYNVKLRANFKVHCVHRHTTIWASIDHILICFNAFVVWTVHLYSSVMSKQ